MYSTTKFRPVREVLRDNGVRYGDIFCLVYKNDRMRRVGFLDTKNISLQNYGYERQDIVFTYKYDETFRGLLHLVRDVTGYMMHPYGLKDPVIMKKDPYFIQRVMTLIGTDEVDVIILDRANNGNIMSILFYLLSSILIMPIKTGLKIKGIVDDD